MASSYNNNRSSAALFLIALLLFSASTPLPVHAQITGGLPTSPTDIIPLIFRLLSNMGLGNLLPQINNIIPTARRLLTSAPVTLSVVGQATCPGLGTGIAGLPVLLSCVVNGNRTLGGQAVTNRNGSFAVNTTVSPLDAVRLITGLLPNNTLPCLVSISRQRVQSITSCPALTNTTTGLMSLVQFSGMNVFSALRRILSANAAASTAG